MENGHPWAQPMHVRLIRTRANERASASKPLRSDRLKGVRDGGTPRGLGGAWTVEATQKRQESGDYAALQRIIVASAAASPNKQSQQSQQRRARGATPLGANGL